MGKRIDLTGQRFGRLTVTALAFTKERGRKVWSCLCDCGGFKHASTETLRAGTCQSCGCLHRERSAALNRTHGKSSSRTFRIWCGIRARCSIPTATGYAQYGGRGIRVCDRWELSYENFLADMGECPDGLSIERRNVDGWYTPDNCYWAAVPQQARNTTRTRYVSVEGIPRVARDVAVERGISVAAFKARLYKYGWSIERACGLEGDVAANYGEAK